jgi:3-dehydroquinate synthase
MTQRLIGTISSSSHAYEIEIDNGMLTDPKFVRHISAFGPRFAIITDDRVAGLYGEKLCSSLSKHGLEAYLFSFPPGEPYKVRHTKELLEDRMFEKGLGRDTCVLALGGGVVTDLGGYVAATYCRGIPLIMIPTSLLGMVDASIGGKTGLNTDYGKNLIGSFYQPQKVFIDPAVLRTLPIKELKNGIVEMIKHGLIADTNYFEYLEQNSKEFLKLNPEILEKAILESCRIKQTIVEQDEKEKGKRHLLNFGHTIGHALEKVSHYSISHGEAVVIGLIVESYIAMQLGYLPKSAFERIRKMIKTYDIPLQISTPFPPNDILNAMSLDKKSRRGEPHFVILEEIGRPLPFDSIYCTPVEEIVIKDALQWMNDALCRH